MALIRDGLTTEMKYAVVSSAADFGKDAGYSGEDKGFWGMLKPPFEAWKIVDVMKSWRTVVYPVTAGADIAVVADIPCLRSLKDLPEPVDCAIISLPQKGALDLIDQVVEAHIPAVWLQFGAARATVVEAYISRGVRVIAGCVLLHWDLQHIHGIAKGRHICQMHGNLERSARIHVRSDGTPERIEPIMPEIMPITAETFGTRILLPIWPKRSGLDIPHE